MSRVQRVCRLQSSYCILGLTQTAPCSRKRVARHSGTRDDSCKRFKTEKRPVLELTEEVHPFDAASYEAHAAEARACRLYHQTALQPALDRIDELEIELSEQRFVALTAVAARRKVERERADQLSTLEKRTKAQLNAAKAAVAKAEKERDVKAESLTKSELKVQDTEQRLGKANAALKQKSAPESDMKRSFEAERHRHTSAESRLSRQLKDRDDELRRLKGFGETNQNRIRELEQQVAAGKSEISVLKSEAESKSNAVQDTEMTGGVAEKGTEHLAAELEDLRNKNAALQKEKEDNEKIMKQQKEEIERLRPEDEMMADTTTQARQGDTQQYLGDIELEAATQGAQEATRPELAPETTSEDTLAGPKPESLSSSPMEARAPFSEMPVDADTVEEDALRTTEKTVEEQELERLEVELYDEMTIITALEKRKRELDGESKKLEEEISKLQIKRQRKYERYIIRKRRLDTGSTAKEFDELAEIFGESVSTKHKKTKEQIEAEEEYGDSQDEDDES